MRPEELIEGLADALNNADLDRYKQVAHPDVVFVPRRSALHGAFVGYEGFLRFVADNEQTFDVFHGVVEETPLVTDEVIVVAGHLRVRGRGAGTDATVPMALVAWLEDGKAKHIQADYDDTRSALADARAGYPPRRSSTD